MCISPAGGPGTPPPEEEKETEKDDAEGDWALCSENAYGSITYMCSIYSRKLPLQTVMINDDRN